MASGELIGSVRRAQGIPQAELARRSGQAASTISQIENGRRDPGLATFERLLRRLGHRVAVIPTERLGAVEWGAAIRNRLAEGDRPAAQRAFLAYADVLQNESPTNRVVLSACEPEPTGEALFDAALAAVTEYFLTAAGAPLPAWVEDPSRIVDPPAAVLEGPFYPTSSVWLPEVPEPFSRRGALVEEPDLASA